MKVWVYIDGRQQGPYEKEQLRDLPGFNENTKVWFEGLPKWQPAGTLDEFAGYFTQLEEEQASEDMSDSSEKSPSAAPETAGSFFSRYAPGRNYTAAATVRNGEPCPPTYIGLSIILLICCCTPFSIGALVASIFVSSYYSRGDITNAKKASEIAAWLIMISIALGFLPVMYMSAIIG